jgi:hypothetical protein
MSAISGAHGSCIAACWHDVGLLGMENWGLVCCWLHVGRLLMLSGVLLAAEGLPGAGGQRGGRPGLRHR